MSLQPSCFKLLVLLLLGLSFFFFKLWLLAFYNIILIGVLLNDSMANTFPTLWLVWSLNEILVS